MVLLSIWGSAYVPTRHSAVDAGLAIGKTGGISTNEFLQTNDPDIYAAGDACEYVYGRRVNRCESLWQALPIVRDDWPVSMRRLDDVRQPRQ